MVASTTYDQNELVGNERGKEVSRMYLDPLYNP